jgi:polar amino acid transport system permease protein
MWERVIAEAPTFFTWPNLWFLAKAMFATFSLSAGGCLMGSIVGLLLTLLRHAPGRWLLAPKAVAWAYVEFFRRVPPLVVLFLVFFSFNTFEIDLNLYWVALIGVCLISTAFMGEIIRAGIESIHPNQWHSAATMNFGYLMTIRAVILPQSMKLILPPAFSFFLLLIKDTAFASQIGTIELAYAGKVMSSKGFSATLAYGVVLILYFVLSFPLARFGARVEQRFAAPRHSRP